MLKENNKIKNSVLIDLFYEDESAKKNQIALYNALHEEKLPENASVRKLRIENTLYMHFQNDFSYEADEKILVIGEHQSTINYNMPLRCLMYIGRIYEGIVPVRDRYKKAIVKLPKPEFYTFYNGKEPMEKECVLRLSEAFKVQDGTDTLELEVKVININTDAGHEILEKCPVMKEYSIFIDTIRKYQEAGENEAYELAIHECIEKGILADYLQKKGSEVINMLKAEYDYELDIQVQREEAYEQGEEAGRQQGEKIGRQQGEVVGRQQGEAIGRQQGKQQANIDAVRNMLEFGVSKADILKKYTKAEYDAAIAETEEK